MTTLKEKVEFLKYRAQCENRTASICTEPAIKAGHEHNAEVLREIAGELETLQSLQIRKLKG